MQQMLRDRHFGRHCTKQKHAPQQKPLRCGCVFHRVGSCLLQYSSTVLQLGCSIVSVQHCECGNAASMCMGVHAHRWCLAKQPNLVMKQLTPIESLSSPGTGQSRQTRSLPTPCSLPSCCRCRLHVMRTSTTPSGTTQQQQLFL